MKIAIHQPQYLPWLGYFDKMDQVEVFVLLDDVQYKKNEWQNRNRIRNARGWQWLTVPVLYEFRQMINRVKIDNRQNWTAKHLKSIALNYSRAPHFREYFSFFHDAFSRDWEFLAEVNIYFIRFLRKALGISAELVKSSDLKVEGTGTERLVGICKKLAADTYLSGAGGSEYLDEKLFRENSITLEIQTYSHPTYRQIYEGFYPYMSVVDLLFCHGKQGLTVIREGRRR